MSLLDRLLHPLRRAGDQTRRRADLALRGESGPGWTGTALIGLAAGATGAGIAYLLDPQQGRSRRSRLTDQTAAAGRRVGRHAARLARRLRSDAAGKLQALRSGDGMPRPMDDATVADRVRSEVFRDPELSQAAINMNVERGIVVLRGEVPSQAMRHQLIDRIERVDGVWGVQDLLHLPGEPAPTREPVEAGRT